MTPSINTRIEAVAKSRVALQVGRGKTLFAVAVEQGYSRKPAVMYFGAKTIEDLRAELVRGVLTFLPKGSRIVGVAPAVGIFHDERGEVLEAG